MPTVPPAPPPAPVIPPPIPVPVRAPSPPLPAVISADAEGQAEKRTDGTRLTFGSDSAALNPATAEAIRTIAHGAPDGADFTVSAYAAGSPNDPSTARRLSLSRGLAVRSVLIGEGVTSTRIYVKALGAAAPTIGDGPPDRADIIITVPPHAAPSPATSQPATSPDVKAQ
jgi:outer membrane protein OmpA-like peptidoglycan-associated protein